MELNLENITIKNNAKYAIWGYGEAGILLCKALQLLGNKVSAFICSDGYKKYDKVDNIKVYEISEYMLNHFQDDNQPIILNTVIHGAQEVEKIFKDKWKEKEKNYFYHVYTISDWLKIHTLVYKLYFKNKGCDISENFLKIKDYTFINPFITEDINYSRSFLLECCDLILPVFYNDFRLLNNYFKEIEESILTAFFIPRIFSTFNIKYFFLIFIN